MRGWARAEENYSNELFDDEQEDDEGPAGRARVASDFEKGSVFTDEDMQKCASARVLGRLLAAWRCDLGALTTARARRENLENVQRLRILKAIQICAALGIALLTWGLWRAYVVATNSCHLHDDMAEGDGDDPCVTGFAGYCLIDGFRSNAHNTKELCEACGCHNLAQADVNQAIDQKDGTFQSYLFADDTGRVQNDQSTDDSTKASGQRAAQWTCTCGSAHWIDGYCDCDAFEDCMLEVPVTSKAFCESIDMDRLSTGILSHGTYGENNAVWTIQPGVVGTCTGTPASLQNHPQGCAYAFDHPTDCNHVDGSCTRLPFSDQIDHCPTGCTYTPAAGTCSVPTWSRRVDDKEDCQALDPPHEWKDGHEDEDVFNNWILAGLIICLIDCGVLAYFWFGKGWRTAEDWGYVDVNL